MTSTKSDDPDDILNCDPAAVAIRASQSYDTLQKLKEFAQQLTRYVGLMEDAKFVDLSQDDTDTVDEFLVETALAVAKHPAQLTTVPRRQGKSRETTSAETSRREKRKLSHKRDNQEAIPGYHCRGMRPQDEPTEMPRKSQRPTNPTTDSPKAAARSVRARSQVAIATPSPASQQQHLRMEKEGADGNNEHHPPGGGLVRETVASNDNIISPPTKLARRTTMEKSSHLAPEEKEEEKQEKALTPRRPRNLLPGCKGDLKSSHLERSVGRTRAVLNKYLDNLCLMAKFGMGVVSKQSNRVSHLTFNNAWNHLPRTQDETLEYWLGEGTHRLALVSPLDPSIQEQPEEGIPVFWACDKKHGGALCHYVGHFRCIGLTKTDTAVMLIKKARQALIEFEFIKFDDSLAQRISNLPESI
jgi:hypothetical protein